MMALPSKRSRGGIHCVNRLDPGIRVSPWSGEPRRFGSRRIRSWRTETRKAGSLQALASCFGCFACFGRWGLARSHLLASGLTMAPGLCRLTARWRSRVGVRFAVGRTARANANHGDGVAGATAGRDAGDVGGAAGIAGARGLRPAAGGARGRRVRRLRRNAVPALLRTYQLVRTNPYAANASASRCPNGNEIIFGIELDRIGRRVAYHFHRTDPGDVRQRGVGETVHVPVEQVCHVFHPIAEGQIGACPGSRPRWSGSGCSINTLMLDSTGKRSRRCSLVS
jgi:hypothetical protein